MMKKTELDRFQQHIKTAVQAHAVLVEELKKKPQDVSLQNQLYTLQNRIQTLSAQQKAFVTKYKHELAMKQQNGNDKQPISQPSNVSTKPTTTNNNNNETGPKAAANLHQEAAAKPSSSGQAPKPLVAIAPKPTLSAPTPSSPTPSTSAPLKVPQFHANRPSILSGGRQQGLRSSPAAMSPTDGKSDANSTPSYSSKISVLKRQVLTNRNKCLSPEEREKHEFLASLDLITPGALKDLQNRRSERPKRSTNNPEYAYGNTEAEQTRRRPAINYMTPEPSKGKRATSTSTAGASKASKPSSSQTQSSAAKPSTSGTQQQPPQPRKRGRPPKRRRNNAAATAAAAAKKAAAENTPPPAKRQCLEEDRVNAAENTLPEEMEQDHPGPAATPASSCYSVSSPSTNTSEQSAFVEADDEEEPRKAYPAYVEELPGPSQRLNTHNLRADIHEDFCAVCRRSGELLMCDTCSLVYHLNCCEPALTAVPTGIWSCQKCMSSDNRQNWNGNLAVVHSYMQQKTKREDEQRREQLKSHDLEQEQDQLKKKAEVLKQALEQKMTQQNDLRSNYNAVQGSYSQMKSLVRVFQNS